MVGSLWPEADAGAVVQPKPSLFLLLLRDFQPFASPNPFHTLVVNMPARVVEQTGHHPITVATVCTGQLNNIVG